MNFNRFSIDIRNNRLVFSFLLCKLYFILQITWRTNLPSKRVKYQRCVWICTRNMVQPWPASRYTRLYQNKEIRRMGKKNSFSKKSDHWLMLCTVWYIIQPNQYERNMKYYTHFCKVQNQSQCVAECN